MREAANVSPFAAKTSQEQKEQWIWWQCQSDAVTPITQERAPVNALPPRAQETPVVPATPPSPPVQATRHHQYDAIMRRMMVAQGKAGAFTSCSGMTAPDSRHPAGDTP